MRVPVKMLDDIVARGEDGSALGIGPVWQVGQRPAGVQFEPVVAPSPGRTNIIGAIDKKRSNSAVQQADCHGDAGRSCADDHHLVLTHRGTSL